jgi:DNA-binding response OmpR family regulator
MTDVAAQSLSRRRWTNRLTAAETATEFIIQIKQSWRISGGQMNILLVEDDPAIREPLAEMLRMNYYVVYEANCGVEALLYGSHKDFGDPGYCMVITDCEMPVMGGIELINQIRVSDLRIPIIAMSGNQDNMKRMMDAGANVFLLKPINFTDLLACITLQAGKAREEKA